MPTAPARPPRSAAPATAAPPATAPHRLHRRPAPAPAPAPQPAPASSNAHSPPDRHAATPPSAPAARRSHRTRRRRRPGSHRRPRRAVPASPSVAVGTAARDPPRPAAAPAAPPEGGAMIAAIAKLPAVQQRALAVALLVVAVARRARRSCCCRSCSCTSTTTTRSPRSPTGSKRYRRVAAQAPEYRKALEAMREKDGAPLLPQEHRAEPGRRGVAGAGSRGDRRQRRPHHDEPEPGAARTTAASARSASTSSSSRPRRLCRRFSTRSRPQPPYLVVENMTLRPLNAFRGFKPAPGQEPEINVQLDVVGYAFAERPTGSRRKPVNDSDRYVSAPRCGGCAAARGARDPDRLGDWVGAARSACSRHLAVAAAPKPVVTALLPEYGIAGGIGARTETVDRTLFNPTRRPAPPRVRPARRNRGCSAASSR